MLRSTSLQLGMRAATSCLLAIGLPVIAAGRITPPAATLVITRVNVVDVAAGRILPNSTVTISGQTITSVAPVPASPRDARIIDAAGRFLIPGLWDMHAHMEVTGEPWLQLYAANGVTGIRDMGSVLDVILKLREATASGRVLGPRVFLAGPILDDAPGDWPSRMRVKTAEEGAAAVRLLKSRGVDLIKVHDHTPREAYFAIAAEARRQNLPLAGHVPQGLTIQDVIDAGQTDIEHLDNLQLWKPCPGEDYTPEACRPFFEMLARRGIWQTPTLAGLSEVATIGTPASLVSADQVAYANKALRNLWAMNQGLFATPDVIRRLRAGAELGARVTSDMARTGVPILAGCDAMIAGFCVHDELVAMVRGGMSPQAALQTATINPARYFGLQQTSGSVAPGQRADLVLLDASPLTDITNVRRIRAVIVAGRFLDRQELDKILVQVKAAAMRQ